MLNPWTWQMAWRDSRGSRRRLALFLSAMVVGVAALVSILSFVSSMERTINRDAGSLLGGDLRIRSDEPISEELAAMLSELGGTQSRQVSFAAQARHDRSRLTRTVRVRAMDRHFPLYGEFLVSPPEAAEQFRQGAGVLVSQGVQAAISAAPGDSLTIRGKRFAVAGILLGSRTERAIQMLMEPPIYMALSELDSLQSAAAAYEAFVRLDGDQDLEALREEIRAAHDLSVRTRDDEKEDWQEFLNLFERFFGITGFFALLLGGLGVGSVLQVHLKERRDSIALLRCMGASKGQAAGIYLAQALMMGLAVGLLAGVVGSLGQVLLPMGFADLLPVDIDYSVSPRGLLAGAGLGTGATLVFALVPLASLRSVAPLEALRSAFGQRPFVKKRLGAYGLVGLGIFICAMTQTGSMLVALLYLGVIGVCLGILALVAFGVIRLSRAISPVVRSYVWRQGMANLHRPNNQTLMMVIALGMGTVMIMAQVLVEGAVSREATTFDSLEDAMPDLMLTRVPSSDVPGVEALIHSHDLEIHSTSSFVRVTVDSVFGPPGNAMADGPEVRPWSIASFARDHPDSLIALEGDYVKQWDGSSAVAPIGITQRAQESELSLAVGDTVRLVVFDEDTVDVYVSSVVPAPSMEAGGWQDGGRGSLVLPDGALQALPHFRSYALVGADAQAVSMFYGAATERFPDLHMFNLPLVLGVLGEVLRRISSVIRFLSLFSVAAGIMVLAGATMVSRQARVREVALLKTLGASRRQVYAVLCSEYLLLALVVAATGLGLALAVTWAVTGFQLQVALWAPWQPLVSAVVILMGLMLGVGLLSTRGVYAQTPLMALRRSAA